MEPIPKIVPRFNETQQDTKPHRELQDHIEKCESGFRRMRSLSERCESGFRAVFYALGAIVMLLVLGLAGLSWYVHSSNGNDNTALAKIPVLEKSADAMGDRLSSIEGKMNARTSDPKTLSETVAKLEQNISSEVQNARNQIQAAANQLGQRLRDEVNQSLQRLQHRVENVEATQREGHDQLAAAENEIGSLRREIAALQKKNEERLTEPQETQSSAPIETHSGGQKETQSNAQKETQSSTQKQTEGSAQSRVNKLNSKVGATDDQVLAHTTGLNRLNKQIERDPSMFELSNNRTQQVAPGIYITIKHTDVAHQTVDGWMQLADEGKIVWIRNLGAKQPLPFVTRSDDRGCELVFTGVQKNGATGYVLLPHSNPPGSSAS